MEILCLSEPVQTFWPGEKVEVALQHTPSSAVLDAGTKTQGV